MTLWIVSLLLIVGIVAFESSHFSDTGSETLSQELLIGSDTLVVEVNTAQEEYLDDESLFDLDERWYLMEDAEAYYGRIELDIEQTSGEDFLLEVKKQSKGRNWDRARENAANIDYGFKTHENRLVLDPYFSVGLENKWRFPRVEAVIRVPEGKVVVLDRETRNILEGVVITSYSIHYTKLYELQPPPDDPLCRLFETGGARCFHKFFQKSQILIFH